MSDDRHVQQRAEVLFQEYLDLEGEPQNLSTADFLDRHRSQEEGLVLQELASILEDYLALREGRATSSDSRHLAGPSPGQILDDYELLRPLGRGGMGVVWEANQISLDRKVAVKILHPHLGISDRFLERFQREAQAGGRLQHSGIVAVHGVGEADGTHFIVQELITDGISLEMWLQEQGHRRDLPRRDYRLLATWTHEIAQALCAAHEAGVIHRDLKPGNILLQDGHPKLADFGLAFLSEEASISLTGEVLGTPYSMSPEQTRPGAKVDARSDLFSLGVTFYRLLTLSQPFVGDTREQVLESIRQSDPVNPRQVRSRMPQELAVICLKLLEKNPAHRYQSAMALAEDLQRHLEGRPILARPPSLLARSWKWVRRHPAPSTAMAMTTLASAVILAFFFEVKQARDSAENAALLAEQRQKTAEAIEGFMIDLFADAGPGGEANSETSAGELLQRGSDLLEKDQSQDPVVRAGLLMALGQVHRALGNYPQAEKQLREALALHETHLLSLDQRTLKARNQLGLLLLRRAQYQEAEQMLLAAQLGHEELYGKESIEALENQGNLAYVYYAQGDFEQAAPLLEGSLRGTIARWGDDHFHTWSARNNLASLERKRGDLHAAEEQLEIITEQRIRTEGVAGPASITALGNLAQTEKDLRKFSEAELHMQMALDGCLETYGEDHPLTAGALRSLAGLRREQDQFVEALELYRKSESICVQKLREGHPSTLSSQEGMVRCLLSLGRAEEALPLAEALKDAAVKSKSRPNTRTRLLEKVRAALSDS